MAYFLNKHNLTETTKIRMENCFSVVAGNLKHILVMQTSLLYLQRNHLDSTSETHFDKLASELKCISNRIDKIKLLMTNVS